MDDGVLDLRMITADESFARVRLLWSVLTGTVATSRITHLSESTSVTVEAAGSPMALAVDGEAMTGRAPRRILRAARGTDLLLAAAGVGSRDGAGSSLGTTLSRTLNHP